MTTYRYLGWGKTNSDGIAKLDHNSEGQKIEHSYTGTGAGEIDVLASLDNPVAEGSIVSEIYDVLDCIKYDEGLLADGHHTDIWRLAIGNNATFERLANYTKITDTNNTTGGIIYAIKDGDANLQLPTSCMIELDIRRVDGSATSNIITPRPNGFSISYYSCTLSNFGITDNDWHTVQLKLTPTRISRMIDGVEITGQNVTDTINYWHFGLWTATDITEIHFRNVKVYPI